MGKVEQSACVQFGDCTLLVFAHDFLARGAFVARQYAKDALAYSGLALSTVVTTSDLVFHTVLVNKYFSHFSEWVFEGWLLPTRPAIVTIGVVWLGGHIILGVREFWFLWLVLCDHDGFLVRVVVRVVIGPVWVVPAILLLLGVLILPFVLVPFCVPDIGATLGEYLPFIG